MSNIVFVYEAGEQSAQQRITELEAQLAAANQRQPGEGYPPG